MINERIDNQWRRTIVRLTAVLSLVQLLAVSLFAQVPTSANSTAAIHSPPPPLPEAKSPVDSFRQLLAMGVEERKQSMSNRPPEIRKRILAKLREYETLKPNQRELRLSATELRWFLWPLMHAATTNRVAQLSVVPKRMRTLVAERLQEWDQLPADKQKEILDNETAIRYFTGLETGQQSMLGMPPLPVPAVQRQKLEQWKSLPEGQQKKIIERFNRFFVLTPEEQDKALSTLSQPERQQIERTLRRFNRLAPAQRAQAINSFEILAKMDLEQRQQFLKGVDVWIRMKPDQRAEWCNLVNQLPLQPHAPPPLPELIRKARAASPTAATNGQQPQQ